MCAALLLTVGAAIPAAGQEQTCGARSQMLSQMMLQYGEVSVGFGLAGRGHIIELLIDPHDGSWTVLETTPWGESCIVATGDDWQPPRPAPESDT